MTMSRHKLAGLVSLVGLIVLTGFGSGANEDPVEARMKKDITFLASPECEGRGVETKGINLAADYIAAEFKKAGLQPAGQDGSYFQPFTMYGTSKLEGTNALALDGPQGQQLELGLNRQFRPLGLSGSGKAKADVVFAGYGATVKDKGPDGNAYDDYKGVDVAGKVVLILRRTPRPDNQFAPFDGKNAGRHASLQEKVLNADEHKVAGVLLVNDHATARANGDALIDFSYTAFGSPLANLPVVHIKRTLADAMIQSALGTTLKTLEEDIDRDLKPRSAPLSGWNASVETGVKRPKLEVKNIIGTIEGSGPLANETIVIGAHYDHLGYGNHSSLAKGLKEPTIHPGADDNGSGSTSVIELARRFGAKGKRDGRRMVFMTFSGEESGLLGSAHYVKKPTFPLANTTAMINLDMVGRLRPDDKTKKDKLEVYGTGSAKGFDELIERVNENYGFQFAKHPSGMGPSDQQSFYLKEIPVFFFYTGGHPDYHRPGDTADKINVAGMRKVADLVEDLANNLRTVNERPKYTAVGNPHAGGGTVALTGPRIGVLFDYGYEEGDGALVENVSAGGPAANAGLKAKDLIIGVEGKPVKNVPTYMAQINRVSKTEPFNLEIIRDGKKMTLKVQPDPSR
jgi:hypothetical protein